MPGSEQKFRSWTQGAPCCADLVRKPIVRRSRSSDDVESRVNGSGITPTITLTCVIIFAGSWQTGIKWWPFPMAAKVLLSARESVPALILSDVMMPNLDGFGLLQAVRADSALAAVPVVLLSARAGEDESWKAFGPGQTNT